MHAAVSEKKTRSTRSSRRHINFRYQHRFLSGTFAPTEAGMKHTLAHLPQEILHHILIYLPPIAVLSFQRVCHAFNDICGPLLWRTICLSHFQYWSSTRELQHKLALPVDQIQWKRIFAERYRINQDVNHTLDSILGTQVGRIEKTGSIVQHGYDAKDVLLENLHVGKDAPDVLSRKWYSRAALTCLHRGAALEQLLELRQGSGDHVPLERALGLFDLFIIQDGKGDHRDISARLDEVADDFRLLHPEYMELNGRERGIAVADFLLAQGLGGIQADGDAHYHDLRNNFLGMALRNDQRSSLPLISVVIYCCIAQRVALDARPCGFPWHVLAIVQSANGQSLNGRGLADASARDRMYMDPFRSANEVRVETLVAQLASMGVSQVEQDRLLDVAPTIEIVSRCATNIIRSFQTLPRHSAVGDDSPSMDAALYGALWTLLLLSGEQGENPAEYHRLRYFPVVLKHVQAYFPNGEWSLPVSNSPRANDDKEPISGSFALSSWTSCTGFFLHQSLELNISSDANLRCAFRRTALQCKHWRF